MGRACSAQTTYFQNAEVKSEKNEGHVAHTKKAYYGNDRVREDGMGRVYSINNTMMKTCGWDGHVADYINGMVQSRSVKR